MIYVPIQPPFTRSFEEMSPKELRDYFEWFVGLIPGRIDQLTQAVRATPGCESWQPDRTPESLNLLGEWFADHVAVRPRTEVEIRRLHDKLNSQIEIPEDELTNVSFSLSIDIGIYLSQVFLNNNSVLRWDQPLESKKFIDYGQPVLIPFRPAPFNPVRMVTTLAYGLVSGRRPRNGLRTLYDVWLEMVG